jgi:hypothetical protein
VDLFETVNLIEQAVAMALWAGKAGRIENG